jgi:hypothetical protein
MAYIFQADTYCDKCGDAICEHIRANGKAPEDDMDHSSFDSDEFPKSYDARHEESDSPSHCGKCGKFLLNPLTSDGYRYVKDYLDGTGATKLITLRDTPRSWANWYDFQYWDAEDCEDDGRHTVPGWYSREMY